VATETTCAQIIIICEKYPLILHGKAKIKGVPAVCYKTVKVLGSTSGSTSISLDPHQKIFFSQRSIDLYAVFDFMLESSFLFVF
jgi:hypothetical protein